MCEPLCGNGVVDPGETCANCPEDEVCPPDALCIAGMCEITCGNGLPDPGEDCLTCPADVSCPSGSFCVNGQCDCRWDLNGDTAVDVIDFLDLLSSWGVNPGHPADFDGDGFVAVTDFLELLAHWGPCP
jgi:hypothetical protein